MTRSALRERRDGLLGRFDHVRAGRLEGRDKGEVPVGTSAPCRDAWTRMSRRLDAEPRRLGW